MTLAVDAVPVAWLTDDAIRAAQRLLGCHLVAGPVVLRIVETEAYAWPDDTASHARTGRTARNTPMWGPPGRAYVYLCYGIHHLLNVVAHPDGEAAAVLVRGAEVVAGAGVVAQRRGRPVGPRVLAGPGKVTQALGVDASWSGHPLVARGGLELRVGPPPTRVGRGPRVGIDYAAPAHRVAPWRFGDLDSAQVHRPRDLSEVARWARPRAG